MSQHNKNKKHQPVLLEEVLSALSPKPGESYLDLTAGYGGHAEKILELTMELSTATLVDRDINAVSDLQAMFGGSVEIIHSDFLEASRNLVKAQRSYNLILADLGVSSPHLDNANRGFTFSQTGPLDMRMDESQELTADQIVNHWKEDELVNIISQYGEDPRARNIAKRIVQNRPIRNTEELAKIIASAWPGRSKVHPATRTFQAIRIATNDELGQLEQSIALWVKLLKPGGRLAVISFHSLEDRIVKQYFAEHAGEGYDSELVLITKKPVIASPKELVFNPRARSARLRAVAKIKTKKG